VSNEDTSAAIRSAAHWRVLIRPHAFKSHRIASMAECLRILESAQVSWRGWPYPLIEPQVFEQGKDWLDCAFSSETYSEYWRYFQSGQFAHLFGFKEDWFRAEAELAAQSTMPFWGSGFQPRGYLSIDGTVDTTTEIFEFAARLAMKTFLGERAQIRIEICNAKDRLLVNVGGLLLGWYRVAGDTLAAEWSGDSAELVASAPALALVATENLLGQLRGSKPFDVSNACLADRQRQLMSKS